MDLPSNMSFRTVVGRFLRAVADGADAGRDPDGVPLAGLTITFTPSVDRFKNMTATPPATIIVAPVVVTTDADGYLVDQFGIRGVRLVATDDTDLQPVGWTWRVSISGPGFRADTFDMALASDANATGPLDLTSVIRVPANPGQQLADWLATVQAALSAVADAEAAADSAEAAVAGVPAVAEAVARSVIASAAVEFLDPRVAAAAASAATAASARDAAVTAKNAAVTAAESATAAASAAAAVPGEVDAAMAAEAVDPGSAFGVVLADRVQSLVPPIANLAVSDAVSAADVPGKVAAAIAAQAGKVVQGSGMPGGVVTATPGTLYVDTAATSGASVWRKATGTDANGWVCVHGDTGWRNIATLLDAADWAAPTGNASIRLRRIGNVVYLTARLIPARTLTPGVKLITAPAGFGAANGIPGQVPATAGTVTAPTLAFVRAFPTTTDLLDYWTASGTAETVSIALSWPTAAAWPTPLPGVAA